MNNKKYLILILILVFSLIGCNSNEENTNEDGNKAKIDILEKSLEKIELTDKEKNSNIVCKYKMEFGEFNYYANLKGDEFIVSLPNSNSEEEFGKSAYKYNIETKEISQILEPTGEKNIFHKIYAFDGRWIIWVEKDKDIATKIGNGKYIIGGYDTLKDEKFIIEDLLLEDYPADINYSNNKIVYSYDIKSDEKYNQIIKSYDLKKKEGKKEYNVISKALGISLSQPQIFNDMIAFSNYDNGSKSTDVFYYNINGQPQILNEKMKKSSSEENLFFNKYNLYRVRKIIENDGKSYKEVLRYDLNGKNEMLVSRENGNYEVDYIDDNYIYTTDKQGTKMINLRESKLDKNNIANIYNDSNNRILVRISNEFTLLLEIKEDVQSGYLLKMK